MLDALAAAFAGHPPPLLGGFEEPPAAQPA